MSKITDLEQLVSNLRRDLIISHQELIKAHADAAVMRGRLEELFAVHEFIDDEELHQTRATRAALATNAGREAVELLKSVPCDPFGSTDWFKRRDTLLATVKGEL